MIEKPKDAKTKVTNIEYSFWNEPADPNDWQNIADEDRDYFDQPFRIFTPGTLEHTVKQIFVRHFGAGQARPVGLFQTIMAKPVIKYRLVQTVRSPWETIKS